MATGWEEASAIIELQSDKGPTEGCGNEEQDRD